jgi:cytosine/uracil/thiamine/allantoin permease
MLSGIERNTTLSIILMVLVVFLSLVSTNFNQKIPVTATDSISQIPMNLTAEQGVQIILGISLLFFIFAIWDSCKYKQYLRKYNLTKSTSSLINDLQERKK